MQYTNKNNIKKIIKKNLKRKKKNEKHVKEKE
jgi:hypothetical protein